MKLARGSHLHVARERMRHREPSGFLERASRPGDKTESRDRLSVCFTGHRYMALGETQAVIERLDALLRRCYERGYRDFYCGGALGFDTIAGERVAMLQSQHPDVRLIMVLPCSDQSRYWPAYTIARYERLLYMADDIRVLAPQYYEGCMQVRNRYMVDRSDLCVCYLRHQKGGTASTVAYALKQGLPILNVAMEDALESFPGD